MNYDYKKFKILNRSNDSYKKCKALCEIGQSYSLSMTDAILYIISSREKTMRIIFHCFNEIFQYYSTINHYKEAGLSYYLAEDVNDELIKEWIDKAGHEIVFQDLASKEYEEFQVIEIDYQLEEYQFNGLKNPYDAFTNIKNACFALKTNTTLFDEDNEEINEIINKHWNEIECERGD